MMSDLGLECFNPELKIAEYMILLDFIMMHAFADAPAGTFRWGPNLL